MSSDLSETIMRSELSNDDLCAELEKLTKRAKAIPAAELQDFIKKYKSYEPEIGDTFHDADGYVFVLFSKEDGGKCYGLEIIDDAISASCFYGMNCYCNLKKLKQPLSKIGPRF